VLERIAFHVEGNIDLQFVIYLSLPDEDTPFKLRKLLDQSTQIPSY